MSRNMRGRVRPGRASSALAMVVGAGMFLFGIVMLGQVRGQMGGMGGLGSAFMLLWLVATGGIVLFHARNYFSERGAAFMEVDLETDAGPSGAGGPGPGPAMGGGSADFESRLRQLARLREDGLITEDEFEHKRAEIMASKW